MRLVRIVVVLALLSTVAIATIGFATDVGRSRVGSLDGGHQPLGPCDNTTVSSWTTTELDPILKTRKIATVTIAGIDPAACGGSVVRVTMVNVLGIPIHGELTAMVFAGETAKTFNVSSSNIPEATLARVPAVLASGR